MPKLDVRVALGVVLLKSVYVQMAPVKLLCHISKGNITYHAILCH